MAYQYEYTRTVNFYETDMAGIAHFSNFFRWMEEAEAAFIHSLGAEFVAVIEGGEAMRGWPRVRAHCEYHAPVRFNDTLCVHLLVRELKVRAIEYQFYFYTCEGESRTHVATGGLTSVCIRRGAGFDAKLEAVAIPEHLLAHLQPAPKEAFRAERKR